MWWKHLQCPAFCHKHSSSLAVLCECHSLQLLLHFLQLALRFFKLSSQVLELLEYRWVQQQLLELNHCWFRGLPSWVHCSPQLDPFQVLPWQLELQGSYQPFLVQCFLLANKTIPTCHCCCWYNTSIALNKNDPPEINTTSICIMSILSYLHVVSTFAPWWWQLGVQSIEPNFHTKGKSLL